MTKSEIFKAAHEMARNTVKAVGNYMVAFKLALVAINDHLKNGRGERVRVGRAVSYTKPVFTASHIAEYIKKNSRIVVEFATLAAYNEAFANGEVGKCWNTGADNGWFAYKYF